MSSTIDVPGAPALPGLRFRQFRGEADFPRIAATLSASNHADGVQEVASIAAIANTYQHLTNCDPTRDILIAEMDDATIGYGRAWWYEQADGTFVYYHLGHIVAEWRRRGIGRAMLHYLQDAMRAVAVHHPADRPRLLMSDVTNEAPGRTALLLQAGYRPLRYSYSMTRDLGQPLPNAPMPAGLEVRPVRPEHYPAIWAADNEAFRDHYGYSPPSDADYDRWLSDPVQFTPAIWRVAWDVAQDEVAGMVRGYIDHEVNAQLGRRRGYTESISTRRAWRKRGLARSLLVQSMALLRDLGMTEAALSVDAQNPLGALQLYESVGFQVHLQTAYYARPIFGISGR